MAEPINFLSNPETGSRRLLGGFIPNQKPSDQPKFAASRKYSNQDLPPSVDLRKLMTPVEDQGESYSW
jgi:hypothetical protein